MKRFALRMILVLVAFLLLSGCRLFPSSPVYIAPGQTAELAQPADVKCWITNADTGKRERRNVEAQAGWIIGRMPEGK